jgi:lysophospholipase L1-like esterase
MNKKTAVSIIIVICLFAVFEATLGILWLVRWSKYNPRGAVFKPGEYKDFRINSIGYRGEEIKEKNGYRIICLGDSTSFGVGSSYDGDYPSALRKLTKYDVINAGIPGNDSHHILVRFKSDILKLDPDMIILWAGWNNIWSGRVAPKIIKYSFIVRAIVALTPRKIGLVDPGYRENVLEMYETCRKKNIRFVVMTLIGRPPTPYYTEMLAKYNNVIENLGIPVIKLDKKDFKDEWFVSPAHMKDIGYAKVAETVYNYLKTHPVKQ